MSGAFDGLEKIVRKRLREAAIGFAAKEQPLETPEEVLSAAQTKDFIEFGFEPARQTVHAQVEARFKMTAPPLES